MDVAGKNGKSRKEEKHKGREQVVERRRGERKEENRE